MHNYRITFKWYDSNIYCTNICISSSIDDVRAHYSKFDIIALEEATHSDVLEAKRKGMPIIEI